ncbi:MAG: DUF4382 domain-containing protein [Bacteroidota bacterium]
MKTLKSLLFLILIGFSVNSCKKDKDPAPAPDPVKPTPYYVNMTDAPGPYSAVYVDIQNVEITGNGSTVVLNTTPGIYNLLNFSNGVDTLIASGSLTVNKVEQIRLILGPNNSVVKNGITYPLSTPSAQQSGLKLQVHQDLQPGVAYYVLLDFDANSSIVDQGNGSYSLKPVIRTIQSALSGSIKGIISQPGVIASVTATSGSLSYSTVVNANGEFLLAGLPPGTYSLTINPLAPFNTVTLNNVSVSTGVVTNVGVVVI